MLSLSYAKLVATPTDSSWSQAYNAGSLFACLALSKNPDDTDLQLSALGKEMFSHLESEFFTLENKDLVSIKEAIANSTHTIPSNIKADLCLAYFKENLLYLFIYGKGKILMKRGDKVGVLLSELVTELEIKSASGILKNGDIVVLETPQFAKDMSNEAIGSALDLELPNDMAEALSPAMHEKDDGGQAAIIIRHMDAVPAVEESVLDFESPKPQAEDDEQMEIVAPLHAPENFVHQKFDLEPEAAVEETGTEQNFGEDSSASSKRLDKKSVLQRLNLTALISKLHPKFLQTPAGIRLNHTKKLFLTIAVVILVVLVSSITLTKKRQEDLKTTALFESVYDPSLKDYEDGKSVESINKIFARDEYLSAQKRLKEGKSKFKEGSKEEQKIKELLAKVEAELGGSGQESKVAPKQVDLSENDFLSVVKANSEALGFAKDQNANYFITKSAVTSVSNTGAKKELIKNDDGWKKPVGLAPYQGNIYVLDTENGVLKYTAGANGFGKSSYFKTKPGNIGNSVSIAIDGSVWVLFKDGTIMKFTRGEAEGFKTKGLDKPFSSPSRIFTNLDTEGLFVLDRGNSRIVKLTKDGAFQKQYAADILKKATEFEASEKDGKILVLSGGKFYELPL